MNRLEGKIAIVTGAGSGMGRATAQRFAQEGAQVIAADIKDHDETADGFGGTIIPFRCDVTSVEQLQSLFSECRKRFARLDVLFNNAGVPGGGTTRLHETSLEDWNETLAVNATGVFLCIKYGVPLMIESGGGSIINTASTQAFRVSARGGAYAPSKAAVVQLTALAALEYAADNIRVNAICPGPTDTAMFAGASPELRQKVMATLPLGRMGKPSEIANLALFLASNEAAFMTGGTYLIDGGRVAV